LIRDVEIQGQVEKVNSHFPKSLIQEDGFYYWKNPERVKKILNNMKKNVEKSETWSLLTGDSPSVIENGLILDCGASLDELNDLNPVEKPKVDAFVTLLMRIYPIKYDFISTVRMNHMNVKYTNGDLFQVRIMVSDDKNLLPHAGGRKWWDKSEIITKGVLRKYFEMAYNDEVDVPHMKSVLKRIRKILVYDDLVLVWLLANDLVFKLPQSYYRAFYNHPSMWQLTEFGIA